MDEQYTTDRKPEYIPLTNGMLFHMVFSKNSGALKSFLSSLLDIPEDEMLKTDILNPMQYEEEFNMNLSVLDLRLHLNRGKSLLIEIQIRKLLNQTDRTLAYACRQLADQDKGTGFSYGNLQPVIQIAIMDHTLFPDHQKFFAKYLLKDEGGYVYSKKLQFFVLDLTAVKLASDAEKERGLAAWANALKAEGWDELDKIENKEVKGAAKTMEFILSDPAKRELIQTRSMTELDQRSILLAERKEAREEGRAEGITEGQIRQAVKMYRHLVHYNESQVLDAIMSEFGLTKSEAEKYISPDL